MMNDLPKRKNVPSEVLPEVNRVVRANLGCGKKKQPSFIGIDRFPLPGVDIVADMNKGLPLADNSVDYLAASHSLEHVDDLTLTMQEIYRVCKHKALVCIVAPTITHRRIWLTRSINKLSTSILHVSSQLLIGHL